MFHRSGGYDIDISQAVCKIPGFHIPRFYSLDFF